MLSGTRTKWKKCHIHFLFLHALADVCFICASSIRDQLARARRASHPLVVKSFYYKIENISLKKVQNVISKYFICHKPHSQIFMISFNWSCKNINCFYGSSDTSIIFSSFPSVLVRWTSSILTSVFPLMCRSWLWVPQLHWVYWLNLIIPDRISVYWFYNWTFKLLCQSMKKYGNQ